MNQSVFGKQFSVCTWGESHGPALGVVINGCPAGLPLDISDIDRFLERRRPGQSRFTTARKESDSAEILSGVFDGKTTGTPISVMVRNQDQRSRDYGNIMDIYRPGHADYTYDMKYGFRDYRGGGRSSGRETLGRVAAGAVAAKFLGTLGIQFTTYTKSIGPISVSKIDFSEISRNMLYMPDAEAAEKASAYLEKCMDKKDSAGGVVECRINGAPAGLGEPVFGKLDAAFSAAIMSIGGVKAVEIGDGTEASVSVGSRNNDAFVSVDGKIRKETNHSGGILGGISDGSEILLRAHIKPTPSIAQPQKTVHSNGSAAELVIHGRHDPVIVPRAVVVVESMAALVLADAVLCNMGARLENVLKIYR